LEESCYNGISGYYLPLHLIAISFIRVYELAIKGSDWRKWRKNLYRYAGNKPLNLTDLLGLCTKGEMKPGKFRFEAYLVGETPEEAKILRKISEIASKLGGPDGKVLAKVIDNAPNGILGVEQLYMSQKATFNIYVTLKYSCCKYNGEWGEEKTAQTEANSPVVGIGNDFALGFGNDIAEIIADALKIAKDTLIDNATKDCKGE